MTGEQAIGGHQQSGLYAGFEGYRSPTDDALAAAARSWLVVLDTNVLLNLYNYQGSSLDDFIRVFEALGERLFIPHQVLDEFWRNRRTVLAESLGRNREQENVEKAFDDVASAFRKWHQRVVDRTKPCPPEILRELDEARQAVLEYMAKMNGEAVATLPDTPTQDDPVLRKLETILSGKVGPAPSAKMLPELHKEGLQRVTSKTPPGYMDAGKNSPRAIGDFLVWRQIMDASKQRSRPVLFVTQDQKEDWWADRGTSSMRARPELVNELLGFAQQPLLMIRAHDLVRMGGELGVTVSQSTLDEVELTSEEIEDWTADLVAEYVDILAGWPQHLQVLKEASANGGHIDRSKMAEILGRDAAASMSGAGLPYNTALKHLTRRRDLQTQLDVPFLAYRETAGWMSQFIIRRDLLAYFDAGLAAQYTHNDSL